MITSDRLVPVLADINDISSPRNHATEKVIEVGRSLRLSPFTNGPTVEEDILFPPCVRLGVAVRVVEIARKLAERDIAEVGFDQELVIAMNAGYIPMEALRPEAVFWEQIIPSYVSLGYFATTS